jgi:hypothetical protein
VERSLRCETAAELTSNWSKGRVAKRRGRRQPTSPSDHQNQDQAREARYPEPPRGVQTRPQMTRRRHVQRRSQPEGSPHRDTPLRSLGGTPQATPARLRHSEATGRHRPPVASQDTGCCGAQPTAEKSVGGWMAKLAAERDPHAPCRDLRRAFSATPQDEAKPSAFGDHR